MLVESEDVDEVEISFEVFEFCIVAENVEHAAGVGYSDWELINRMIAFGEVALEVLF